LLLHTIGYRMPARWLLAICAAASMHGTLGNGSESPHNRVVHNMRAFSVAEATATLGQLHSDANSLEGNNGWDESSKGPRPMNPCSPPTAEHGNNVRVRYG